MSKLDLIRAGHTEVADGQCWLCDVPWPCDTGVVLAALTAAEARAEQAERERDASVKARMDWQADYDREKRQHHARLDALRERLAVAEELADQRMRHRTEQLRVNARLRERLATVEAALLIADELSDDLEDVAQELANRTHGQPRYEPIIRAALQTVTRYNEARAALAATPAAGEVE